MLKKHLTLYGAFLATCSILVLGWMLSSPSEPGNAVLFGFSFARLFLALGLVTALVFFLWLTVRSAKDKAWAEKTFEAWFGSGRFRVATGWLGGLSFGLGWIGSFVPSDITGKFEGYWAQLQPVMLFILLTGIATLTLFYIGQKKFPFNDSINPKIFRLSVVLFLVCMPVLAVMLFSRFGIYSPEDFWYGAGVPILAGQLIAAVFGGLLFWKIEKKYFKGFDLVVFLLIFAVTALLWAREPLLKSFMFVGPYPPNQVLYPFADASKFDVASQFALIGQRLFIYNSNFFERPLYLSFLVYLHTLFGQDYGMLMAVQAAIFAVFPALIYLIGKSLNLRTVGFAAALVAMWRGVNSIAASNMMDMANPKMMLTDFPAAIGVALIVLVTCEWLKSPAKNGQFALWLGGALGFTLMLRTNALILLALIPLYAFLKFAPDWKKWLFHFFLILIAVVAITLPWELRNRSLGGQMYGDIISKFRNVINQRYTSPSESTSFLPTLQSTHLLSILYQGDRFVQAAPECSAAACFVPNHFLHNIITSILILPTSSVMDNLRHTIGNAPYWNPLWDGAFTMPALFFFILNVFIVILGISVAWDQRGLHGIAPLAIFMFYNLSNAFARTSGGRYIVPMDWIVTIYFLLGIFQIAFWFAKTLGMDWKFETKIVTQSASGGKFTTRELSSAITILILLLGFGSLIPLSENLHLERYHGFDAKLAITKNEQSLSAAGLSLADIESFLRNPDAELLFGRAVYPRYYRQDHGELLFYPTLTMPFPRTTFTLIGPAGEHGVVLPGDKPKHFPHASDVIVIGCKGQNYFDALAVIVLNENNPVYTRSPEPKLLCD